jgi:hypothetical protein
MGGGQSSAHQPSKSATLNGNLSEPQATFREAAFVPIPSTLRLFPAPDISGMFMRVVSRLRTPHHYPAAHSQPGSAVAHAVRDAYPTAVTDAYLSRCA